MIIGTYDANKLAYLQADWSSLLASLGASAGVGENLFQQLAEQYLGENRYYHTLDHIYDTLAFAKKLSNHYQINATKKAILHLAVWFHDVVYDTHAADNEEKSAVYAQEILQRLKLPNIIVEQVGNLILSTKAHRLISPNDITNSILLDADLSILGAMAPKYDAYALAIRQEYAWVNEVVFKAQRKAVLQKFLERPSLYFTAFASNQLEATARLNLQREIETLELG